VKKVNRDLITKPVKGKSIKSNETVNKYLGASQSLVVLKNVILVCALLSFLAISLHTVSCRLERDTVITVQVQNPPTFRLTGNGNQDFLVVRELSPKEMVPYRERPVLDTPILWQIWPNDETDNIAEKWPPIIYGKVPPGFSQTIPENGEPKMLEEDKFYEAGGPASNANGGSVWFTIRNGKAVEIPKPGGV
jgi:hypothetical protein